MFLGLQGRRKLLDRRDRRSVNCLRARDINCRSDTLSMSYHPPPTQFSGKIWIYVAQAVVVGGLTAFCLLLGPLFLFELIRSADGRPTRPAGIALCILSVPFLLVFLLAAFNIAARRRPLLRLYREGIEMNMIGASSLDGSPIPIPKLVRVAWLIVSLQGFHNRPCKLRGNRFSRFGYRGRR